jgi:hypothetical protein
MRHRERIDMGYTTEFEGRFLCYRPESPQLAVFLDAIREGDRTVLGPLGDFLIDHDDPRGEVITALSRELGDLAAFWRLFGLRPEHAAYLKAFSETRRIKRDEAIAAGLPDPIRVAAGLPLGREAGYFVGGEGFHGQLDDDSVIDGNRPPRGQPGLWCQWIPDEDGTAIVWDGVEKFYYYGEWLRYLLKHFLAPWGYVLNGEMKWQGEDESDVGTIVVVKNAVDLLPG